ncbi:hypothetical protein JWG44_09985 [Leptospira sp. 201903071]|uniref:hypothetical protein n=1 Tax=Leptospira ainazelensis TaxID=2810034 RepID=UPI00196571B8|nr:hypothetical protein [Leptospira ainazelensis]MBM9500575.1 hypothetical protein [Leptospira ainazelensis]
MRPILILSFLAILNTACIHFPYRARVYASAPSPKMNELKSKKWAILPTLNVYPTAAVGNEIDARLDLFKSTRSSYVQVTPADIKKSLSDVSFTKSLSKIYTSVWEKEKADRVVLTSGKELLQAQLVKSMSDSKGAPAANAAQTIEADDDFHVTDLKGLEGDFKSLKLKQDYAILPVLLDYRPLVSTTDVFFVIIPFYIGKTVLENYTMTYFVVDLKTGKNVRTIRTVLGAGGVEDSNEQIDAMLAQVLEN